MRELTAYHITIRKDKVSWPNDSFRSAEHQFYKCDDGKIIAVASDPFLILKRLRMGDVVEKIEVLGIGYVFQKKPSLSEFVDFVSCYKETLEELNKAISDKFGEMKTEIEFDEKVMFITIYSTLTPAETWNRLDRVCKRFDFAELPIVIRIEHVDSDKEPKKVVTL